MMKLFPCLAVVAVAASLACRPPEFEKFAEAPPVVEVAVTIAARVKDAPDLEREFAAALRARLALYATVVPEGVTPPRDAVRLKVEIDKMSRKKTDAVAIGAGAAIAAGTIHTISRGSSRRGGGGSDFMAILDAILFGLDLASDIEARQQSRAAYLGFYPPKIAGLITLERPGDKRPIFIEGLKSSPIIEAMSPIRDIGDTAAVDAEVARALAKVVMGKLRATFDWRAFDTPSWYEPPKAKQSE